MKSLQRKPHLASCLPEPLTTAPQWDTCFILLSAPYQALALLAGGTLASPTQVMGELNSLVP